MATNGVVDNVFSKPSTIPSDLLTKFQPQHFDSLCTEMSLNVPGQAYTHDHPPKLPCDKKIN